MIAIDFETYYDDDCSVVKQGPETYTEHPEFDIHIVSLVGNYNGRYHESVDRPEIITWPDNNTPIFVAHNARFDRAVFEYGQRAGRIPKRLNPTWICSADMAAYFSAPRSLAKAANAILGKTVDKQQRTDSKGKRYYDFVETGTLIDFKKYCLKDSQLCAALIKWGIARWPDDEIKMSKYNMERGRHGIHINMPYAQESQDKLARLMWDAERNIPWEWDPAKTPTAAKAKRDQCKKDGIPMPSCFDTSTEEYNAWEEKYAPQYPWINAIRIWARSNILRKKVQSLLSQTADVQGLPTFRYSSKYFGAFTGRFTGGSGDEEHRRGDSGSFNIMNLPRAAIFGIDLRSMLLPRPGHKFIIADYSQIEARLMYWFAGNRTLLANVKAGTHLYEAYARKALGWTGGDLKTENKDLYSLAKVNVLGCNAGAGAAAMKGVAAGYGVSLTLEEATKIVSNYRRANPDVVKVWKRFDRLIRQSAINKEDFVLTLPSGRDLVYRNPIIEGGGRAKCRVTMGGPYVNYWYGRFAINLVQATARDVLCHDMLRLWDAGYRHLFDVYDEFVFEVEESKIEQARRDIYAILSEDKPWLPGCPIDASLSVEDCYTK